MVRQRRAPGVEHAGDAQRLMARDFERQVAELQVRIAVLNGDTALGIPVTEPVGSVCPGIGEARLSADLCNRASFFALWASVGQAAERLTLLAGGERRACADADKPSVK